MASKPLILLGSSRKSGDTAQAVASLFGPRDTTIVDLLDYTLHHYRYDGQYPSDDDFDKLLEIILQHEKIVLATPVYWYAMSGRMKVFFDRLTDIVTIQKSIGRKLKGKTSYLLAVGADDALPEGFEVPFRLTSSYLDMKFMGTLYLKNNAFNVKDDTSLTFKQLVLSN